MKKALIVILAISLIILSLSACSKPENNSSEKNYGQFVNSEDAFKAPDAPDKVVSWPAEWNSSKD